MDGRPAAWIAARGASWEEAQRGLVLFAAHASKAASTPFRYSSSAAAWQRSGAPGSGRGHQQASFFPRKLGKASSTIERLVISIGMAQSGSSFLGSLPFSQSLNILTAPARVYPDLYRR